MRFKDFIGENSTPAQFDVDQFFIDCAPFLDEIRGIQHNHLPKHGSRSAPDDWEIIEQRVREKPRDSADYLHDAVNELLYKKFNWQARSDAIFITGDAHRARNYGPICTIFPIGKFDTLWSPEIEDLFMEYSLVKDRHLDANRNRQYDFDEVRKLAWQDTIDKVRTADWRFNKDLSTGLGFGFEIMLRAKRYYLISNWSPVYEKLIDALRDRKYIK